MEGDPSSSGQTYELAEGSAALASTSDGGGGGEGQDNVLVTKEGKESIQDDIQKLVAKAANSSEQILCLYLNKNEKVSMLGTEQGTKFVESGSSLMADFEKFCQDRDAYIQEHLKKSGMRLVPDVNQASEVGATDDKQTNDQPNAGKPTTTQAETGKPTTGKPTTTEPTKGKPSTGQLNKVKPAKQKPTTAQDVDDKVSQINTVPREDSVPMSSEGDLAEGLADEDVEKDDNIEDGDNDEYALESKDEIIEYSKDEEGGWDLGEWIIEREKCPHCDKTFKDKIYLKQHMDMHSDLNYLCPVCKKDFTMRRYVFMHLKRVHHLNLKHSDPIETVDATLPCPHCPVKFAYESSLNEHVSREHQLPSSASKEKSKTKGPKKKLKEEVESDDSEEPTPRKKAKSGKAQKSKPKEEETKSAKESKKESKKPGTRQQSPRGRVEVKEEVGSPHEVVIGMSRSGRKIRFPGWKYGDDSESSSPTKRIVEESITPKSTGRGRKREAEKVESKGKRARRKIETKDDEDDEEDEEDDDDDDAISEEGSEHKGDGETEKYKCPYCTSSFRLKRHCDRHISDNHEHECKYCNKVLHTKADLKKHQARCDRAEKGKTPKPSTSKASSLTCRVCKKSFTTQNALDKHGSVHMSKIRKCPKCSRSITGNRNFQLHLRKNHNNMKEQKQIFKEMEISPEECSYCKFPFIDQENLDQHIQRFHSEEANQKSSESVEESASADESVKKKEEVTGKKESVMSEDSTANEESMEIVDTSTVDQEAELKMDIEVPKDNEEEVGDKEDDAEDNKENEDEENEDEEEKDKTFRNQRSRHSMFLQGRKKGRGDKLLHGRCRVKRVGGKVGYNCLICNKLLSNRLTAVRHMERHDEELDYQHMCEYCYIRFENRGKLIAHVRSAHMWVEGFTCTKCSQKFATATYCKEHMKTCQASSDKAGEDGEMFIENGDDKFENPTKYKCIICNKKYETDDDKENHLYTHLSENGTWLCPYCEGSGGIFKDKGWLVQHIWKFHGIRHFVPEVEDDPNSLKCNVCFKKLLTKQALEKHKLLHKNTTKCPLCSKEFSFPYQLRNHLAIHGASYNFTCQICKQKFKLKRYLQKHMQDAHNIEPSKTHTGPRCNMCEETVHFFNLDEVYQHAIENHGERLDELLKKTLKDDVEGFTCRVCFKNYGSHKEYVTHVVCHTKKTPLMCETCGKYFDHKTKLQIHQGTHNTEKNFECSVCNNKYSSLYNLRAHMRRHSMLPAICETCGMTFKSKDTLQSHLRVHDDTKRFSCEVCGYMTRTFDGYKCHLVGTHPEVAVTKSKNWKIYTCEYCGKLSSGKQQHTRHVATHTGEMPFVCPHCGYKYATKGALNVHIKNHSDVDKPFYCEPCDLKFLWANKMQKHMESARHLQACAQAGIEPEVIQKAFMQQFTARRNKSNRGYHANRNSGSRRGIKKINLSARNKEKGKRMYTQKRPRMTQKVIYVSHPDQEVVGEESVDTWGIYEEEVPQEGTEGVPQEIQTIQTTQEIQIVEPTEEETLEIATSMSAEELAQGNTEYVIITVPQDAQLDPQRMVYDIQAAVQSILK